MDTELPSLAKAMNLIPKDSLLNNTPIKKKIHQDLPKTFEDLQIPIFIGCTQIDEGGLTLLSAGDLESALLATIAIP